MTTATHMRTPVGPVPIRPEIQLRLAEMSDREVADAAFQMSARFINPEMYAELVHRGLSGPGVSVGETYRLIEAREQESTQ
ncbi:hypothetical protein [Sediminicurvatus halobius]|uniref:Uncharacterized protein n=1 Tax=Sediminicurvatus halobius TaxID=2182432 RepID=A0A2U2MXM8_9GAMM|nr:hypothetical protein [Spiribacter halobius]PWG61735.1 hypothetical protein DEM34_14810 [Spiribacter halobius]UEX76836.1 hypothetical protein LMH63_12810 [Spiribacter halobius]